MTSQQFYLNAVTIHKVPNFDGHGLCQPFIKIYQGMNLIYCSPILHIDGAYAAANDAVVFSLKTPLKVRGEILLKCYHRRSSPSARVAMFSLQFHTATLSEDVAIFPKEQIDIAAYDKRFHDETKVELLFNEKKLQSVPEVRYIEDDIISKWNSYENFMTDESNVEYTKGPLDGSLYATVAKRSPTQQHSPPQEQIQPFQQVSTGNMPVSDEKKLDELLSELLLEIEDLPDFTVESPKSKEPVPSSNDLQRQQQSTKTVSVTTTKSFKETEEVSSSSLIEPTKVSLVGSLVQHQQTTDTSDFIDAQTNIQEQQSPQPTENQRQLTWLQKQQLKLKSKQVDQIQQKRHVVEKQLIAELKSTIERNGGCSIQKEEGIGQSMATASPQSSLDAPTPVVPVRTSSRNILMFAEQSELGQVVRTLSLDHSPAQLPLLSNGNRQANYQLASSQQYSSTMPTSMATSTPTNSRQLQQSNWKQNGADFEVDKHQQQLVSLFLFLFAQQSPTLYSCHCHCSLKK